MAERQKRKAQEVTEAKKKKEKKSENDIEKINIERRDNIAKAQAEINTRERLTDAQKSKETIAMVAKFTEKAATDTAKVREDQERSINQMKAGYAQSNVQMLGKEYTEVQRVTDQIAQQPAKLKEKADEMLKIAAAQDAEKKRLEEIIRLRQAEREAFGLMTQDMNGAIQLENQMAELNANALGTSKLSLSILQAEGQERLKLYDLANNVKGAYEANMIAQGRIDELTKEQIKDATTYNELLAFRKGIIENEKNDKIALAELDKQLAENFAVGWEGAYNRYVESSKNAADQAKTYFGTFSSGIENVFYNMAKAGEWSFKSLKDGFRGVANSMIADFMKIQAQKALVGLFGGAGSGGTGGLLGSLFGGIFGGGRAVGGPVSSGTAYMVGEQGPELFIPKTAGTIVPNNALGGSSNVTNVTYSIQAVDASSFRSLLARDPEFIHNVAEQGRRSLPIRSRR